MLIIADDLTGASDTAVQFRKNGYSAVVCVSYPGTGYTGETAEAGYTGETAETGPVETAGAGTVRTGEMAEAGYVSETAEAGCADRTVKTAQCAGYAAETDEAGGVGQTGVNLAEQYDVMSVNTDTRPLSGEQAYERVRTITKELYRPGLNIYKKMDSVLRGNPGPELEAVMDAAGFDVALTAPSFPGNGRKITDGMLCAGGRTFSVPELFAATMKRKVRGVSLETVRKGTAGLYESLREGIEEGIQVFVFDSETDDDLRIIARTGETMKERCVMCGSAGLAKQLKGKERGAAKAFSSVETGILIVVGSRCTETKIQVERAVEKGVPLVCLNTEAVLKGDSQKTELDCAEQILRKRRAGSFAVIAAVDSLFGKTGFALKEAEEDYSDARQIVKSLGRIMKMVFSHRKAQVIVSVGGDTSQQLCEALGASGIEILDEIMPGVPVGLLIGGAGAGTCMITKSGGFGGEGALLEILEYIGTLSTEAQLPTEGHPPTEKLPPMKAQLPTEELLPMKAQPPTEAQPLVKEQPLWGERRRSNG